jgi:hypothetical protein
MKSLRLLLLLLLAVATGCNRPLPEVATVDCGASAASGANRKVDAIAQAKLAGGGAMLASRFTTFEELKSAVKIEYFSRSGRLVPAGAEAAGARVTHCSHGQAVVGILAAGISQGDILKAQSASIWGQMGLVFDSPYAVAYRADLQIVIRLARRRPNFFGEGDPAFLDFAETMVAHINTPDLAFLSVADTSEKGYLNTFNHVTAQAFITAFFSEELADFVGDVHERHNMPELVTGIFSDSQLVDPIQNPVDNYVDIINNEWGQELGNQLKAKYHIDQATWWTPALLANFLNDIQAYFSWTMQIGFRPFRPEDEIVTRFTQKINYVKAMHTLDR